MTNWITKMGLGAALAATAVTAAAPADAQRYGRYRRGGGDVAAGAVLGGIVGLGLGAAIASSNRDRYYYRDRYYGPRGYYRGYDRGYYGPRGYYRGYDRGYYGPRGYYPAPRGYYGRGYGYYGY